LSRYPATGSEWNRRNLETVRDFSQFLDLGRQTWNLYLNAAAHQQKLRGLFLQHGPLFIKSVVKGWSGVYPSWDKLQGELGDVVRLEPESLEVLVSEVIEIRPIRAATPGGVRMVPDEWRHHVYRQQIVASTHAFDCNESRTDDHITNIQLPGRRP
jgi:hypothetical protein